MTPSSATRLRTPFEPTIAVLTAPARMRKPTTTTNARRTRRTDRGGTDHVHGESTDQVVAVRAHADVVGDDHDREERDQPVVNIVKRKMTRPARMRFGTLGCAISRFTCASGLLTTHGENRVSERDQDAERADALFPPRAREPAESVVAQVQLEGRQGRPAHPERQAAPGDHHDHHQPW